MAIDPKTLPPKYQAQIAEKLLQNAREAAGSPENRAKKESKYHNIPETRVAKKGVQIRFSSGAEARRYDELKLMLKAGKIRNLKLQPQFTIQEAYTTPEGERVRAIRYHADFSYEQIIPTENDRINLWTLTVEDVKCLATRTEKYKIKKKLMRERFGIEIWEIEG